MGKMDIEEAVMLEQGYSKVFEADCAVYRRTALESIERSSNNAQSLKALQENIATALRLMQEGFVKSETRYRERVSTLESSVGLPRHRWQQ